MTGSKHRRSRAVAGAFSFIFLTGAIAQSAPQRGAVRVAQGEAPQAQVLLLESTDESSTLDLSPAYADSDMTGTMIMRLVSQVRDEETSSPADREAAAKLKSRTVQQALRLRGARYRYGGTSRGGFDCSGFTRYVYSRMGVSLPHSSAAQFGCGRSVSRDNLKAGDLVFFGRGGRYVGHVGIFVGGDRFVHASNPSRGVTVDSLNSSYYSRTYRGARRIRGK